MEARFLGPIFERGKWAHIQCQRPPLSHSKCVKSNPSAMEISGPNGCLEVPAETQGTSGYVARRPAASLMSRKSYHGNKTWKGGLMLTSPKCSPRKETPLALIMTSAIAT